VTFLRKVVCYRQRSRANPARKLITFIVIVCISLALYFYAGQAYAYWQTKRELNKLIGHMEMLKAENAALQGEILLLHDPEYLELRARRELGLVRPGEIIFSVGD
jgi:cell division protein FtsB